MGAATVVVLMGAPLVEVDTGRTVCSLGRQATPSLPRAPWAGAQTRRSAVQSRPIDRHDRGAPETDVVLKRHPGAVDLSRAGLAAKLPRELRALGEAGGAERVALGDQPTGRVDDPLAAIRRRPLVDERVSFAGGREAERLVGDQLVGREAVVQLDDVHVLGADTSLLVCLSRGRAGHGTTHDADRRGVEAGRRVGPQRLAGDLDRALPEAVLVDEPLARDDRAARAVGGRRALQ